MSLRDHHRRGAVLIWFIVLLTALMALASLGVDFARVQVVKTQLRRTADAAARYAANGLADGTAVTRAITAAAENPVNGVAYTMSASDAVLGNWSGGTFAAGTTPYNAVKLTLGLTAAKGNALPLIFGSFIGQRSCDVTVSVIATGPPVPPYSIVGLSFISMSGGTADSFLSSSGTTNPTAKAVLASNGDITLVGGAIENGDAVAGVGHQVSASGGSSVTGLRQNLTSVLSYPSANAGNYATTNDDANFGGYINGSKDLTMAGNSVVNIPAGNYYVHNWTMNGGGTINFTGKATIYVTGTLNLSGGAFVNTYNGLPDNLQIQITSSNTTTLANGVQLKAVLYGPQSPLVLSGSTSIFGAVVAASITETGGATIFTDRSSSGVQAGVISLVK
ncbi:MAG TPA: pilus assembly protein TadG-related protein [Humisphaera sp.]|jgi:Flp pilus assembly protein TadG|nr:pilus assembly protein TadG-related protein [Humisphaera sp.]